MGTAGTRGEGGAGAPPAPRPRPTAPLSRSNWAIMGWESREVLALWDTPCPIAAAQTPPADTPCGHPLRTPPSQMRHRHSLVPHGAPPGPLSSSRRQPQHPLPHSQHTPGPQAWHRGGPTYNKSTVPKCHSPAPRRTHAHRGCSPGAAADPDTGSLETPGATTPISHGDTDTRQCRHPVTRTAALAQARVTSRSQACSHQHLSLAVTHTPDTCCDTGT